MSTRVLASVLIDFENIYYFVKNNLITNTDVTEAIANLITALKKHLVESFGEQVLSLDAYADFDQIEESAQSQLYLLGVETHNVLGTEHKNAADMRLCIDALDILHTRPEVSSFILVAGDRDYIPVIQYLKKRNRTVRVVGFQKSMSGDLLTIVGSEFFVDAAQFLPAPVPPASPSAPSVRNAPVAAPGSVPPLATRTGSPLTRSVPSSPHGPVRVADTDGMMSWEAFERRAIEVLLLHFRSKPEVWLTPYLNKLRAEISELTEGERRQLITRLADKGAFAVEKRRGEPNDYSVLVMNWNSSMVQSAYPGA